MRAMPSLCWRCARPRLPLARSASKSSHWKSVEWRISVLPSRRSGETRTRFMLQSISSWSRNLMRILTLALGARLPTIFSTRDFVRGGGFMSYGPSYTERFARAADYVDKILRGAKPGEIPVEQPTKFELVINLITAQALGLEVPPTLLARADEVIE